MVEIQPFRLIFAKHIQKNLWELGGFFKNLEVPQPWTWNLIKREKIHERHWKGHDRSESFPALWHDFAIILQFESWEVQLLRSFRYLQLMTSGCCTCSASSLALAWTSPSSPSPSPASSSKPLPLGRNAPALPRSDRSVWRRNCAAHQQRGTEHATVAISAPISPQDTAPLAWTQAAPTRCSQPSPRVASRAALGAARPLPRPPPSRWNSRPESFSVAPLECFSSKKSPLATSSSACSTLLQAHRWWSWDPAPSPPGGCPCAPARHGRPWWPPGRPRQPQPQSGHWPWTSWLQICDSSCLFSSLRNHTSGSGPPKQSRCYSTALLAHHSVSPSCASWTSSASVLRQRLQEAPHARLHSQLLWRSHLWVSAPRQLHQPIQRLPLLAWHHCLLSMSVVGDHSHRRPNHDRPRPRWASPSSKATSSCSPCHGPCSPGLLSTAPSYIAHDKLR